MIVSSSNVLSNSLVPTGRWDSEWFLLLERMGKPKPLTKNDEALIISTIPGWNSYPKTQWAEILKVVEAGGPIEDSYNIIKKVFKLGDLENPKVKTFISRILECATNKIASEADSELAQATIKKSRIKETITTCPTPGIYPSLA